MLTCVPFLALGLQNYGGEILLRVYLFALPAASVLAAYLFFPGTDPGRAAAQADATAPATLRRPPAPTPPRCPRDRQAPGPVGLCDLLRRARRSWPAVAAAAVCAIAMTGGFFIARYGNEAWEQIPRGELAAMSYLYAHDQAGARVLWLSQEPPVDVTPEMPWQYRDIEKIQYLGTKAPVNPAAVGALVASLRAAGPAAT